MAQMGTSRSSRLNKPAHKKKRVTCADDWLRTGYVSLLPQLVSLVAIDLPQDKLGRLRSRTGPIEIDH